jgi:hypothetical protein
MKPLSDESTASEITAFYVENSDPIKMLRTLR